MPTPLLRQRVLRRLRRNSLFDACWNVYVEGRLALRHASACRKARTFLQQTEPLCLELGGGNRPKPGWVNVDLFTPSANLALDLRRPLPFPTASVDHIYAGHLLEHFSYPHPLRSLLAECFRVLKEGGTLNLAVPDFARAIRSYAQQNSAQFYAELFWASPDPDWCVCPMDNLNWLMYMGGEHRFMFDVENLTARLTDAGFHSVTSRPFDPSLDIHDRQHQSLYMLATKTSSTPTTEALHQQLMSNDASAYDGLWSHEPLTALYADSSRYRLWRHICEQLSDLKVTSVLDIGCGAGHLLEMLTVQLGIPPDALTGIDYSAEAVMHAASRVPGAHFLQADAHALPFADQTFDLVVACETLEHVAEPARILREGQRVLRPGGHLILTIPNGDYDHWEGHAHFWSQATFTEFAAAYPLLKCLTLDGGHNLLFVLGKAEAQVHAETVRER